MKATPRTAAGGVAGIRAVTSRMKPVLALWADCRRRMPLSWLIVVEILQIREIRREQPQLRLICATAPSCVTTRESRITTR
jgi:hypothetical protein